jgi:hypothetical protein
VILGGDAKLLAAAENDATLAAGNAILTDPALVEGLIPLFSSVPEVIKVN